MTMKRDPIRFNREICGNLNAALEREWLETNGLGGFSSSTIIGLNTRRYHGLLTAAMKPPVGRFVLLSKLEETLVIAGRRFDLSANRYPGVIHPRGHEQMKEFRLDPFPLFTYQIDGVQIEKRVFMVHGENTTVVEYEARGLVPPECVLEIRPLIAFRDYHAVTHRNEALDSSVRIAPGLATVAPYSGLPALHFAHNGTELEVTGHWYENFEYGIEQERGLDYREDLFNPFVLRFPVGQRARATIIASTESKDVQRADELRCAEIDRRAAVLPALQSPEPLVQTLAAAADHFIVRRDGLKTIIAGYHWFSDWGRDTMVALPGLTLVTGRAVVARDILSAFGDSIDRGMLPNRFPDAGDRPEYNTVDATLWFFEAIRAFAKYTGDFTFVESLYGKLKDIVDWHLRGTRYGIRVDSDGLLASGEPGVQLTWMDVKIGDWVVTPRHGKPVEIQALWYNTLCVMEEFASRFADNAAQVFFRELAARARDSFNHLFWNWEAGCLYDVVDGGLRDASIRPNQVFAVSLPHTMLSHDKAKSVVSILERKLLTPLGLRSLSPRDPRYRPRYEGGVWERDSAYHQGTVWPWLMGPFITAYVKVNNRSGQARTQAAEWLEGFLEHMQTAGLGQVSEIADGDPPHKPRGCIAQAWSVAELLRCAVEDVYAPEERYAVT